MGALLFGQNVFNIGKVVMVVQQVVWPDMIEQGSLRFQELYKLVVLLNESVRSLSSLYVFLQSYFIGKLFAACKESKKLEKLITI